MKLTEQNFQNLVSYWAGKLKLPLPLFRRDNRARYVASIVYCKDCEIYNFNYNFQRLKDHSQASIASIMFHELGHIKHFKKAKNLKERIEREYIAEKYSLDCIKKYYPEYLKEIIKNTKEMFKDKNWRKNYPEYIKAFSMIKEYREN